MTLGNGGATAPGSDEMVDGQGGLRPHWRPILGGLQGFGAGGLQERVRRLDRAFAEEGVTAVLPGVTEQARMWRCDPVPLPLSAAEFMLLEAGLRQRARLMSALIDDLYGPQATLRAGVLPPALVYANPAFLRACHDPAQLGRPPHGRLQFYAADLLRGPDGAWRVLADRTAAASGIGHARENRRLLGRVLPEPFRLMQLLPHRPFFDRWQDALQRLAPGGRSNPSVALLTAGTADPHWFEHMYLARELSCALVESSDLTVRAGQLFLKTLKGLQRVDVLLRRVDGGSLDPLELDGSNMDGVSGLLDAARGGNLTISNDPGTGVAEAPGLAAFMPALARHLLAEPLLLDAVPSMWLGEPQALADLLADVPAWRLRPALDGRAPPVDVAGLAPAEGDDLLRQVAARPWLWSAVRPMSPSVAPCFTPDGLQPRPVVLRMFAVFDGVEWQVMPGGLARVVEPGQALGGTLPPGGLSKDVWVLSEERASIVGPAYAAAAPVALRRSSGELPSRVADDLFWLGRTIERLERAARLVRAAVGRLVRAPVLLPRETAELQALLRCLGDAAMIDAEEAVPATLPGALLAMLRPRPEGDRSRGRGSILRMFNEALRLTEAVRDRLTDDTYATFTQTLAQARRETERVGGSLDAATDAMVSIQRFATAVSGVAAENMVRGGGFLFLDLGRRLERAQAIAGEVASALDQPPARVENGLLLILELCDSTITYRTRYLNALQPAPVLDLVLCDQGNPRGLGFQLAAIHGLLDDLTPDGIGRDMLAGAAAGLLAEVEAMVDGVLNAPNQAVAAAALAPSLREASRGLADLSGRIDRRFFALLPALQKLGWGDDADDPQPNPAEAAA